MGADMSTTTLADPETLILSRVIGSPVRTFSPEVAREFLGWKFSEADCQRMTVLAEKARDGTLTR